MITALQHGIWKNSKRLVLRRRKKSGGIHQPLYGTWAAVFMLRQDAARFSMLGKYDLSDKKIPWKQRR